MQGQKDGWLSLHDYVITEELQAAECPLAGHVLNKPQLYFYGMEQGREVEVPRAQSGVERA